MHFTLRLITCVYCEAPKQETRDEGLTDLTAGRCIDVLCLVTAVFVFVWVWGDKILIRLQSCQFQYSAGWRFSRVLEWLWALECSCFLETYLAQFKTLGSETHLLASAGGRAVWDVGLHPLACSGCGFESHRGHGCLFVKYRSLRRADHSSRGVPTDCGASLCVT